MAFISINNRIKYIFAVGLKLMLTNLLFLFVMSGLIWITSWYIAGLLIFEFIFLGLLYSFFWLYAGTKIRDEGSQRLLFGFSIGLIGILPNFVLWFIFRVLEAVPLSHAPQYILLDFFYMASLLMPFLLNYGIQSAKE